MTVSHPHAADRMTTRDAGFLYLERPHAGLHIGCVAVLEGELARDVLRARLGECLPRMRRYRQRAVGAPLGAAHPAWEDDPHFDPAAHVFRWRLPAPGGPGELEEAVADLLARPLDRNRPLWEMHILEGLDGGRSALFQKVHHCMVDGMAGAQLLEELLQPAPRTPVAPPPEAGGRPGRSGVERLGRALWDGVRRGRRQAGGALGALTRPAAARATVERLRAAAFAAVGLVASDVPEMPWNAPLGPRRRLAFTRLPMEGVRRVRAARGGTVNDIVLSVIAGGLHRYLRAAGMDVRGLELTALVPVSLRSAGEARALGNRISALLVPLCVDLPEEVPRLAATRTITEQLKERSAWVGIDALLSLLDELPPALVQAVGSRLRIARLANLIVTNVPGPRETRYLGRLRVEALLPVVPIADALGLGIAVFSYDGVLHVGLNADADRVADLEKLRQGLEDAFAGLVGGA
jgi:WS/DGAT/MGAT family acyltransferase